MKKLLFLAIVAVFGLQVACAQAITKPSFNQFMTETVYPATVLLYEQSGLGNLDFACTATAVFHYQGSYLFLTASHCVSPNMYITSDDNGEKTFIPAHKSEICGNVTQGVDACFLVVKTDKVFPVVPLGTNPTSMGENFSMISVPNGLGKNLLKGDISSLSLDRPMGVLSSVGVVDWHGFLLLQLPGGMPGSSGSALICENQRAICGVLSGTHYPATPPQEPLFMATPIERFKSLIRTTK